MVVGMNVEEQENQSEEKAVMHHIMELFERSLATLHATQYSFPNFQAKQLRPAARTQRSQGGRATVYHRPVCRSSREISMIAVRGIAATNK